jgi:hypothetical protein
MSRKCFASNIAASALLLFLGGAAAQAAELTFSPAPVVAGQPFTATFRSTAFACGDEGLLQVLGTNFTAKTLDLAVIPPDCPIIPIGFVDYAASTTVGALPAGTWRVTVFQDGTSVLLDQKTVEVRQEPVCEATETSLCLDGHFEVTGEWTDFQNRHGVAHAVPDDFQGLGNYGVLWFFSEDNPEMVVKVLNACSFNSRYWVFLSPASTVEYHITVRDVRTGQQKTYSNASGHVPSLTADTAAFPCSN